jgi:hypothetical protein
MNIRQRLNKLQRIINWAKNLCAEWAYTINAEREVGSVVSGKLNGACKGTSYASIYSRKLLRGYRLPFRLPTWIQNPKNTLQTKMLMTHKLGTFVGRTIPVLGWVIIAADVAEIGWKTTVNIILLLIRKTRYGK